MSAFNTIRALFIALAFLLVGAAAAAFYFWKEDRRGQELSREALEAFHHGDRNGALQKYTDAIGCRMSAHNRALAYSGRSSTYLAGGELDRAIGDLDEAVRLAPEVGELFAARADDYLQKGDVDRALADYSQAITRSPNYFPAFLKRARILLERNQADAALADLDEAVRIQPDNAEALQDRGNAYRLKGDWKNALVNFESVLRVLPPNRLLLRDGFQQKIAEIKERIANDLREQGVRSFQAGDFKEAIRFYDDALAYRLPAVTASTVLTNRANAQRMLGEREKAAEDYDEAIRLNPDATLAWFNRAAGALELGKVDEALADLTEVLRQRPSYAPASLRRAEILVSQGEFEKANADFEAALLHFEEVNAAERLAAVERVARMRATSPFAILRDGAEAVQLATALCIKTEWMNSKSMDTLAAAYAEAGLFDEAVKAQSQALQLNDMPAEVRRGMEQRLELYQQQKPFHYPER